MVTPQAVSQPQRPDLNPMSPHGTHWTGWVASEPLHARSVSGPKAQSALHEPLQVVQTYIGEAAESQ